MNPSAAGDARAVTTESSRLAESLHSLVSGFGLKRATVTYVSTPITTGRRFYDWRASSKMDESDPAYDSAHAREVVAPNEISAKNLVAATRHQPGRVVVIDPTALRVTGWTQTDFHSFWIRLITDYVGTVVFNDGWEFSTGCALEYAAAVRTGARTYDANFSPLESAEALGFIDNAIERLRTEGHLDDRLTNLAVARTKVLDACGVAGRRIDGNGP